MNAFLGELRQFLDDHRGRPEVADLRKALAVELAHGDPERLLAQYDRLLEVAEALLWQAGVPAADLARYQALFRERELLAQIGGHERRPFVVVIPVADRPRQLERCLESLLGHLRAFHYGGEHQGRFPALRVLVADDSARPEALACHGELARRYTDAGLKVIHFGPKAQARAVERLEPAQREVLAPLLGPPDRPPAGHKGPSRMRNLALLALRALAEREPRLLFLFMDSDQTFEVLHCHDGVRRPVRALNHFHHIERLFERQPLQLLTGKVVGDPPVAPAVMAGNVLEDVIAFLDTLAKDAPEAPCCFHGREEQAAAVAYHDMADLFGYAPPARPRPYRCQRSGAHSRLAALEDFAAALDRFFDGEHPTRVTCHDFHPVAESLAPARTVYTGNYVTDVRGLRHCIPFSELGLRMAGPVLGRLLRAELGSAFASAALPLLHQRTEPHSGRSEYRRGVRRHHQRVELADEFERQFYGDVMLFAVERLVEAGYPAQVPPRARLLQVLEETAEGLERQYARKREQIAGRLARLEALLQDSAPWWNRLEAAVEARRALGRFLDNMQHNFGSEAPVRRRLADAGLRRRWLERMAEALERHPEVQAAWEQWLHGALKPAHVGPA